MLFMVSIKILHRAVAEWKKQCLKHFRVEGDHLGTRLMLWQTRKPCEEKVVSEMVALPIARVPEYLGNVWSPCGTCPYGFSTAIQCVRELNLRVKPGKFGDGS